MAGLVPAISIRVARPCPPKRDHRDKPGDDDHSDISVGHSGARARAREPGIQKPASCLHLDSGSGADAPSRNDERAGMASPLSWPGLSRLRAEASTDGCRVPALRRAKARPSTSSDLGQMQCLGRRFRGDNAKRRHFFGKSSRMDSSLSCFGVTSEGAPIIRSSAR